MSIQRIYLWRSKIGARGASLLWLSLLASSSCTNSLGNIEDQQRISGVYVLNDVNGAPVPTSLQPEQGCNRTARKGIFSISTAGPDVRPTYSWTVSIDVDCQPVPAGLAQGDGDVGAWRFQKSTQLAFGSIKDHGFYSATLDESGNSPAITFPILGNSYRFVRVMRWDDPQGVVYVKVVDQFGQPVPGVALSFTFANGLEGGGTTPDSGEYGTGGVVGECRISMTAPAGYQIPASQANPFSVSVVEGPPLRVQVAMTKM